MDQPRNVIINYNTSVHVTTKHNIPYELVFGKIVKISSNEILAPDNKLANYDEYLIKLSHTTSYNIEKYS